MEGQTQTQNQTTMQRPDNYLMWAILSTVLCCLPLGIASIYFSSKVDSLWNDGLKKQAVEASKKARLFSMIAAGVGLGVTIIYLFIVLIAAIVA